MITVVLAALLGFAPPQEEGLYRDRILQFLGQVERGKEEESKRAEQELLNLPPSLIPLILELAPPDQFPMASAKVRAMIPPSPWRRLFNHTIGNAQRDYETIRKDATYQRAWAINRAIVGLACIPTAEAASILETLAASKDPVDREFAVAAKAHFRPKEGGPFGKLLDSPVSCDRAADLVILTGEIAAIPQAVEAFCRQEDPESRAAARVLEAFGAGEFVDRIIEVLEGKGPFSQSDEVLRILGRTGGDKAERALREALKRFGPDHPRAGTLLQQLEIVGGSDTTAEIREFRSRATKRPPDRNAEPPIDDPASALKALEAIRADKSILGPIRIKRLMRFAYPELKGPVLDWVRDPKTTPETLQHLLPLAGAVGGREAAPLLIEKLDKKPLASTGAADGLALNGDPAHARDVWKAFTSGMLLMGTSMVSFPPECLDEELPEHLATAKMLSPRALQLARMRPTPAIRRALFERLEKGGRMIMSTWEVPALLEQARDDAERASVANMRKSELPMTQMHGHFLAMRSGDAAAADALAGMLTQNDVLTHRNPRSFSGWRECEKAGAPWKEAVAKAWKLKPDWMEGLLELARWGDKEALEQLKAALGQPNFQFRPLALTVLARQGDPAALEWFLAGLTRSRATSPVDDDLLAFLLQSSDFLDRLRIMARATATEGGGLPLALLAQRTDPEMAPIYRTAAQRGFDAPLRAMTRLKDPAAYGLAVHFLRNGAASQRTVAAACLGEAGNPAAVPHLLEVIDDMEEGWDMRIEHADARIYETAPPRPVAVVAMAALEKLTGTKAEGTSISDRRDFWRKQRAQPSDPGK